MNDLFIIGILAGGVAHGATGDRLVGGGIVKRDPLRIRLSKTKTIPEIEQMMDELEADPDSKHGATGGEIYNNTTIKKLDEMTWAIYYISKRSKPEHVRKASDPEMKNW